MDFEQYLKENRLTVKEFSQKYDLDYYCLARVKKGRFTRNQEINNVFEMLGLNTFLNGESMLICPFLPRNQFVFNMSGKVIFIVTQSSNYKRLKST